MNCLYIDYASLYGVKPGENDFSGAIDRSLEQGIKHVSENFLTELSELLTERRNERRNERK